MPTYKAPLRDMRFVYYELFDGDELAELPGCEEATPDLVDGRARGDGASSARRCCSRSTAPATRRAAASRTAWCARPTGFKEAYDALPRGRLDRRSPADPEYGGQGLPYAVGVAGRAR